MSKANQAFKQNDEAVSPVIGVILMVAITVVLAAVVFVLVSNLGEGADANKPRVSFSKDENGTAPGGIFTVVSIENGPIYVDLIVLGGSAVDAVTDCEFNGVDITAGAGTTGKPAATAFVLDSAGTTVALSAGDQIECLAAGTITISEFATGTLLYSGSFQ